jgi:hypothetical protein
MTFLVVFSHLRNDLYIPLIFFLCAFLNGGQTDSKQKQFAFLFYISLHLPCRLHYYLRH